MTRFMVLSFLFVFTACGPLVQSNPAFGIARGVLGTTNDGESTATGPGLSGILNREFIDAQPNNLMLATVISSEATALLGEAGVNGTKVTWFSPDGISLTFDRGVMVATRGLGGDLMGADVSGVVAGFDGEVSYMRTHDYLNGLDQIETRKFNCSVSKDRAESITIYDITHNTDVFVEVCDDGRDQFRNTFWRTSDGIIWQARQWISGDVGYVGYQRL